MTDIHLREFVFPDDYPSVLALWKTAGRGIHVGPSDEPKEIQKKLHHDPDLFLVAEADGKAIGTVIGGFDGRRGLIYHLAVDAAYRQHGIGRLMMDEIEHRLKAKGCLKCYLMVAADNDNAIQFYEGQGWVRLEKVAIYTYSKEL
jgi:ribosomal protein S18 acetylase RimI-like enzyme